MDRNIGYRKLFDHYNGCIHPGLILGDAEAIVGQFGLEIISIGVDLIKHRRFYKEGDIVAIIKFTENLLHVDVGHSEPFAAPYEKFKWFRFKNKLFVSA